MNRIWILAGITVASAMAPACQVGRQRIERTIEDEQQLMRIEQAFAEAAARRDAAFLARYMSDDFVGIDHLGQELNKAEILARLQSPDYEVESLTHENIRVRIYGDCAVSTARSVVKGRFRGQEVSGEFPYLRVWIRREARWLAVATQSTSVPPRQAE